jgi:hypothetical protein
VAIFKEIRANEVKTARSFLSQLVDVLQEDISGSVTRQKHQVFVTGGVGPGVTSSLFQTIYDQDFSLQTANPMFDMTVGLFYDSSTVQDIKLGEDSTGKLLFPSSSMMMREKVGIYSQFAQLLLVDASAQFSAPFNSTDASDLIDEALFLCFKRLFHRDGIKRETFAMRWYQSASRGDLVNNLQSNLDRGTISGSAVYTDVNSSVNKEVTFGGQVANVVDSANTDNTVGLVFNDRGIVVLDLAKIISGSQFCSGTIDAMNDATGFPAAGQTIIGGAEYGGNPKAKFIPDFLASASIDNIIDHFASTRFGSGSFTAITFQNVTNINSTLFFCRATADEFNYSSNPTFVDSDNRIVVIDEGAEDIERTFTFVTSVGLYDADNNLLAVAKLSRPVEKSDERDLTFRVRLDY